jgi:[acyl-carrier-protein] S-malonyltransferase
MFSVIFPGQGSQIVGMGKEFHAKFNIVQKLFKEADEVLNFPISDLILNGPKEKLNLTVNTQPAIFLVGYSIFQVVKQNFKIDLNKAKFFAGHSLGEYTALASAGVITFSDTLKILKVRGEAMQSAVPKGEGGMVAVLGSEISKIEKIIENNKNVYECFIANDNSTGQIVVSGYTRGVDKFILDLKKENIKNIKLPVSAPFHCKLMKKATDIMNEEIKKVEFKDPNNILISNVTATEMNKTSEIKDLLIKNLESRVRWRESVLFMISKGVDNFIEIGPGKVLSGLIKRINKDVKVSAINNEEDINTIDIND